MRISYLLLFLVALTASIACGCEKQRRIPYIPPELAAWEKPYQGSDKLKLHAFKVGTVEVASALIGEGVLSGAKKLDLAAFVITHRTKGAVVFDPGPSPDFYGPDPPSNTVVKLLGLETKEGQDLLSQMEAARIDRKKVSTVVVSSLRFYRAGGVELFPKAVLVTDRKEREAAEHPGLIGFYRSGEFDQIKKWRLLSFPPNKPFGTIKSHIDLLGDGSIIALPTPGQSAGGLSLLVKLASRPVLLVGDLAWRAESIRFAEVPRTADNRDQWWDSVWRLKRFADLAPELILVPGCDLSPLTRLDPRPPDLILHELEEEKSEPAGGD